MRRDQRPLQFAFGVLLAEFQEIEGVLVLDRQLGLGAQLRRSAWSKLVWPSRVFS